MKKSFFFSFNSAKSCYCLLSTWLINEKKKMKASQNEKHLGQSVALGAVLVITSLGVFVLMMMQSGAMP
jgi:hypothetical protein